jgi:hypothetical protein
MVRDVNVIATATQLQERVALFLRQTGERGKTW